ncbi:MAG: hypothetical protein WCE61_12575, partial [Candidatus Acidiferrum sp.]
MEERIALVRAYLRGVRGNIMAERAAMVVDTGVFGDGSCVPGERSAMRQASLLFDGAAVFACRWLR